MLADRRARRRLALAFGACDATAVMVGAALRWQIGGWGLDPVPIVVAGAALCLVVVALRRARLGRRSLLYGLPILLSFDNLVFGAAAGHLSLPVVAHAGFLGLASGSLALLGLTCGGAASRLIRAPAEVWAALGLLLASCVLLLA